MPTSRLRTTPVLLACGALAAMFACAPADDAADTGADTASVADTTAASTDAAAPFATGDVGLETPESVLYDELADTYLVSNVNGEPVGADDNGFIARIRPDGTVEELKWIDGAADEVTLNAPKGLALSGDTLFVADIDSVRAFHRTTGAPLGVRGVPGAAFLNDMAVGADGAVYVTDTGVDASFTPNGKDAVYRFDAAGATAVASGPELLSPNGIVVGEDGIVIVTFGSDLVLRLSSEAGAVDTVATLPGGQLDGIVRTDAGEYIVSSWEAGAVYRIAADGRVATFADNLEAPADIGYDGRRRRILVPLFMANRIEAHELR